MVLAQPHPKPDLHVCRCHASEESIIALVVRKVVDAAIRLEVEYTFFQFMIGG
jgi:hypothetical protein